MRIKVCAMGKSKLAYAKAGLEEYSRPDSQKEIALPQ